MTTVRNAMLSVSGVVGLVSQVVTTTGGAATGDAVDLLEFDGIGLVTLNCAAASAGTTPSLAVTVTECDTESGVYSAVAALDFEAVTDAEDSLQVLAFEVGLRKRFLKVTATPTGADGSWEAGVEFHLKNRS